MLASIHPLGERARSNRWSVTVGAYIVGSVMGGATFGATVGAAGAGFGRAIGGPAAWWGPVLAVLCVVAAAVEVTHLTLPSWPRQVNEDWLTRYRGWVYGVGFGFQLGVGVITIVTTAGVYLWPVAALLTGSPRAGGAIGAAFGLSRALPVLAMAGVHGPTALRSAHHRLARWAEPAVNATATSLLGVGLLSASLILGAGFGR